MTVRYKELQNWGHAERMMDLLSTSRPSGTSLSLKIEASSTK
jgi:hypothetical protein